MGFATTFRFGNPFFLGPDIDELFKRTQLKDNFSIIRGKHTIKTGGEWVHTNNAQVFRGGIVSIEREIRMPVQIMAVIAMRSTSQL